MNKMRSSLNREGSEVDSEDENKHSVWHTLYKFSVLGGRDGSAIRGYAHEQNKLNGSRVMTVYDIFWALGWNGLCSSAKEPS